MPCRPPVGAFPLPAEAAVSCCEMDRIQRWAASRGILWGENTAPLLAARQIIEYVEACEEYLRDADIPLPPKVGGRVSTREAYSTSMEAGEFLSVAEIQRRRAQRRGTAQERVVTPEEGANE